MNLRRALSIALLFILILTQRSALAADAPGKYGITTKTLDNGMEIIVAENHGQPLATIELVAKNGAYTEPPDFNGLSHLYEHMFFKSNATIPTQEKYMERLRELGAVWNGTTSDERVNYFMTVHKKFLREGAIFLRDALRYPLFKEEELRREWPVVLGEFDRNEANPHFHLSREVDRLMWHKYFSRKNTIGNRDVIFNATREQMKTIQSRYYVPNNCAMVVTGDVNPDEVFDLGQELYGDWPRGEDPHKKWPVPEHPPLEQTSRIVVTGPVKTATISISWHGPSVGKDTAATYAADALSFILSQADSNFQKALVDTGLVDFVHLTYSTLAFTGPISLSASTSPDRLDKAWEAINAELAKLDDPAYVTDEQITAAKNMTEVNQIRERERPSDFAHSISYWWCVGGLDYYLNYVENLKKVGRPEMAKFVQTYIKGKKRVEAILVSESEVEKLEFAKSAKVIKPEKGSSIAAFNKKPDAKQVTTEEFDVDGLKVVLRTNPASEMVSAVALLRGGLPFYGPDAAGRELLLLETIDKGSAKFSKEEVNRQMALTGAGMGADARSDYSTFSLDTPARDFEKNFAIFADALVHPLLKEEEAKLTLEQRLNAVRAMEQNPDAYIAILAARNFFKGHPYEVPSAGTEKALAGVTAEVLKKIHAETFNRARIKLFIVGNLNKEKATGLVKENFKDLPAGSFDGKPTPRAAGQKPRLLAEKLDLPTNYVFGAFDAPNLAASDFYAMQVAMAILDDRFFEEIRTKRNLTYAVSAQISNRAANYGVFYVTAVKPNETVQIMLDLAAKFAEEGPTAKEMTDKVQEMITGNLMKNQTNGPQAGALALYDAVGSGWKAEADALDKIAAVTQAEVKAASQKYLKNFTFTVLGDPTQADEKVFTSR